VNNGPGNNGPGNQGQIDVDHDRINGGRVNQDHEPTVTANPVGVSSAKGAAVAAAPAARKPEPRISETRSSETRSSETKSSETRNFAVRKSELSWNVSPNNLEDEIRRRAYELYEQRGYSSGNEADDWFAAEREVLQRYHQHSA
jgi:hypothetical protein